MKNLIALLYLSLLFSVTNGQDTSSIIGIWKIVSVYHEGIYFNLKKDSISLSKEKQKLYPNISDQKTIGRNIKMTFFNTQFHFKKNGIFNQTIDTSSVVDGLYQDFPLQGLIELTTKNSLNQNVTDKIKYVLKGGLLYLSFKWDDDTFDFVLEKNE
jgi:hypothetical protein